MTIRLKLIPIFLILGACGNDGSTINKRGEYTQAQSVQSFRNGSDQEASTVSPSDSPNASPYFEHTVVLGLELALSSLVLNPLDASGATIDLESYMGEHDLRFVLLTFCVDGKAVCRMMERDLANEAIAPNIDKFAVLGLRKHIANNNTVRHDFVRWLDEEGQILTALLGYNFSGSADRPLVALVARTWTSAGVVWVRDLITYTHAQIKAAVEAQLQAYGL